MLQTKIIIKTKDDEVPAFPEIVKENFSGEGELHGAAILESGMQSGKTSIGLVVKMTDGKFVMVQTSGAILDMLYHAYIGAEQRFNDIKSKKY